MRPTSSSTTNRTGILVTMCLALVAVVASVSGLNVALNEIAADLGASSSSVLWIVNAYTLVMAALLLPVGELGDRWGRKRMLVLGLGLFAAANLGAAMASSVTTMIAFRSLAGLAAAMVMPATLSTLTAVFPPDERGKAVGIWAGFAGAGGILGLFSSAIVVDNASWPWVFSVPIVVAVVALVATLRLVPETSSPDGEKFDWLGAVLSAVALGSLVLGVEEGPHYGWTSPLVLAALAVGTTAIAAFIVIELKQAHPLIDLRVFSQHDLATGSLSLATLFALMLGAFLVVIQLLQIAFGYSAIVSSAGLLPMAAAMIVLSPLAPRLAARFGLTNVLCLGLLGLASGFALLAMFHSSYIDTLPGLVLIGIGAGLAMSPATAAITDSFPSDKQGVASALNDTVREFGSAMGLALVGSVLAAGYGSSIATTTDALPEDLAEPVGEGIGQAMAVAAQLGDEGDSIALAAREAFLSGFTLSMWVAAGVAMAVAVGCRLSVDFIALSKARAEKPGVSTQSARRSYADL